MKMIDVFVMAFMRKEVTMLSLPHDCILFFLVIMFIIFTNDLLINVFTVLIDYFIFFIILIIIFNGQQYLAV